jgi:ABC-type multidrug transport system permease subunit
MNMMFSALWGVGYVVVRYRKNGALKRLKVTPLNAFEYLTAGLMDVSLELIILTTMTLAFLIIGASLFSWNR